EFYILIAIAAAPARPDGMDHMARRQIVAACDLGIAGFAPAERSAFAQQLLAGGALNGAVDAATAEQAFVRRVDDRVHLQTRNIAKRDFDRRAAQLSRKEHLRNRLRHQISCSFKSRVARE